jgi:two-component system nitrate/nitrite sensor histidine kinase NarX
VLGELHLGVAADAVLADATVAFHRTIGALLGLALSDAGLERDGRKALAADVHDGIAQTLAFARMRMPLLEEAIVAHDGDAALRYCTDVRQSIGTVHTNLRAILAQSNAPIDPKGLKHAIRSSVRCFQEQTQVDLVFDDGAPQLRLSATQEAQVYLIVQEALANIAKHAGARHAWLNIAQHDDRVHVVVEDDGSGLPAPTLPVSPSHFGMDIMRQRAARLGGEFDIAARNGGGTRISLVFPAHAAQGLKT